MLICRDTRWWVATHKIHSICMACCYRCLMYIEAVRIFTGRNLINIPILPTAKILTTNDPLKLSILKRRRCDAYFDTAPFINISNYTVNGFSFSSPDCFELIQGPGPSFTLDGNWKFYLVFFSLPGDHKLHILMVLSNDE